MTGLPPTRRAPWFAVVFLVALPALGLGQIPDGQPPPVGNNPDPITLPSNRFSATQIKAAHEYIAAKDWDNACKLLQRVLDEPEDSLLETNEKDPQGKPVVRRTSARAEAERLLSALPKQGLAVYRVKVGGLALAALGRARANPLLLDEVVRRYFLTDAGAEALMLMGVSELDRGRIDEASDRFRRLLQRPELDDLPLLTLFQAALAFHAAGDSVRENQAVQILGRRIGPAGLAIGGKAFTLDDLRVEISRWPSTTAVSTDWPLFRGDPRRTGRTDGDFPILEARNRAAIPTYDEVNKLLAPLPGQPPVNPGLPGFIPLAVGGKLIYRGPDGLHGLDAESGKEVWHHNSPMSLDSVLKDDQKKWQMRRWLEKYRGQPSLLDENAMLGDLSSDGRRVYFVEDLPVPPHPTDLLEIQQGVKHWFSTAEEHLYHNRLRAVDVLTGEPRWDIGAWDKAKQHDSLKDFDGFLGAPLPIGRRLFALAERHEELTLLCLDAESGALIWSQSLGSTSESLPGNPSRRMQPVHLAYGDGVLVCPTNAGWVVAVDPLSHNLLWAYKYRDPSNAAGDMSTPQFVPEQYEAAWKGATPLIHGDRVLLTATDRETVQCLNLRDGKSLWAVPRSDEDLYVAGVFGDKKSGEKVLIVGKSSCRAVNLSDGQSPAGWDQPLATGAPSGQGTASGKFYLLPLQSGAIFLLDMANPKASTQIEGQPAEALGNLVFHGSDLWSQSATAVTAYPQLGKGLERAEARVAKNPHDPAARIDRGRLLYSKGEAGKAVEDWLVALDNNPPADLAASTRERLFNALTQMLQEDFPANEKYLEQYEKLSRRPAPADATPAQAQAFQLDQRRRLQSLLAITAHGREVQGRLDLAVKAYRDVFESALPNELMIAPEDPSVRVRADLWVQNRIAALARTATPEQRKGLQNQIDLDWKAAQAAGDEAALTRFVAMYGTVPGPLGAAGREARLLLAERWLDARDRRHAMEAELHLHYLRQQKDSPETAARAQYAWAQLLTRHGLLADAVEAYRALARDFPTIALRDGKTGAALVDDLAQDKRFLAYLDDPLASQPAGKVKWIELQEKNTQNPQEISCDPQDGVVPPSCRHLRFTLDMQTFTLQVASTDGTSAPWSAVLPVPMAYLRPYYTPGSGYVVTYQATDHFMVLSLGPLIVGVDRIERRARWVRSLVPGDLPANTVLSPTGPDGSIFLMSADGRSNQRVGLIGPINTNGVYVQTKTGVAALDLATGDLRWLRNDSAAALEAFGDEEHLYVVEMHAAGDVRAIRALRVADGVAAPIANCVDCYNHHLRILGRCLLSSEPGPNDAVQLRYYDVLTGKDLWAKTFPAKSIVLESTIPELAAVAAPDGTVTLVDLSAQKEWLTLKVDPKHVDQLIRGMLIRDRKNYYLAFQTQLGPGAGVVGDPSVNFAGTMKATEVNGMIYAFERVTGELRWNSQADSQMLLLDQLEESPVLLLTAIQARPLLGAPNGQQIQVACTRSIEKRTGLIKCNLGPVNNPEAYFGFEVNPRTGTVDLFNSTTRLRHFVEASVRETPEHKGG